MTRNWWQVLKSAARRRGRRCRDSLEIAAVLGPEAVEPRERRANEQVRALISQQWIGGVKKGGGAWEIISPRFLPETQQTSVPRCDSEIFLSLIPSRDQKRRRRWGEGKMVPRGSAVGICRFPWNRNLRLLGAECFCVPSTTTPWNQTQQLRWTRHCTNMSDLPPPLFLLPLSPAVFLSQVYRRVSGFRWQSIPTSPLVTEQWGVRGKLPPADLGINIDLLACFKAVTTPS